MILNIRGFYGSGKSTLVRRLLDEHGGREIENFGDFKAYEIVGHLFVVGRYDQRSTGTGDRVNGEKGKEVMRRYSKQGIVIVENVNSSLRPTWLEFFLTEDTILAALDTPFEECIRRIHERRATTGRNIGRPLKLEQCIGDHALVAKELNRAAVAGLRCYWLDHRGDTAYRQVLQLLRDNGWKEQVPSTI